MVSLEFDSCLDEDGKECVHAKVCKERDKIEKIFKICIEKSPITVDVVSISFFEHCPNRMFK